jgi:hypothetical protein
MAGNQKGSNDGKAIPPCMGYPVGAEEKNLVELVYSITPAVVPIGIRVGVYMRDHPG